LAECSKTACHAIRRSAVEKADHRQNGLLRAHRERPSRRAAEQRDELAPLQLITSSARATRRGGKFCAPLAYHGRSGGSWADLNCSESVD